MAMYSANVVEVATSGWMLVFAATRSHQSVERQVCCVSQPKDWSVVTRLAGCGNNPSGHECHQAVRLSGAKPPLELLVACIT